MSPGRGATGAANRAWDARLEKLTNLDALPDAVGFTVVCSPVKLAGLGAGWTRVVAVVDGA
ncbi:hypothetical protein R8Z50_11695 [Longispora sp. K20-0274]|uniref:hypothetical protein n=1 Tax=Longispora sp. K20-0274 TaxID=3088255 RepID=UPI00399975BA